MKGLITLLFVVIGITSTPMGFSAWKDWSVWDRTQVEQHLIRGTVKAIAVDDINDRLLVKIRPLHAQKGQEKVVMICTNGIQSLRNQSQPNPKTDVIRAALTSGKIIELSYKSAYDKCVETVTLYQQEKSSQEI